MKVRVIQATADHPGAIAIIQLIGESETLLHQLTGVANWPLHALRLADFAGIDQGIAVRLSDSVAQVMPHGGPRVMQRLLAHLGELGAEIITGINDANCDAGTIYPEAADCYEALMMLSLARAQSPLAVDLLLQQPIRWRELSRSRRQPTQPDHARSARLNRLIDPPSVVVVGAPNVGKSTLSNALLGRSMSIALDLPGTTRDYTAGRIDLAGLVVNWYDTPGMRSSDDPIEQRAILLAQQLIQRADLVIAMRDPDSDWPTLPRQPDLRVMNKADLLPVVEPISDELTTISAAAGQGLDHLVREVRDRLVPPDDLQHTGVWIFDRQLLDVT